MDSIIDTALASAAGTLAKELEPAAVATLQDLKTFVHGQADRLRTALPVLEQKALEHVRSISNAVLGEYDNVLARIDSHLAGAPQQVGPAIPVPGDGTPSATGVASNPVDPTQAPSAPTTEASSAPSSAPSENSGTTSSDTVATPTTDTPAV